MAITINGKTYRNLQEQVLQNQKDIEALQAGGGTDISGLTEQVSELNQQMARTLKLPMSGSPDTRIVAVNGTNDQEMLNIGNGLSIEYGSLVATGGGGGSWKKGYVMLYNLADTFTIDTPNGEPPVIIGIETETGYFTATLTNNAQASSPSAVSTLFYAFNTICCITSEDGTCRIIDAQSGQTPPNDGEGATIEYWYL